LCKKAPNKVESLLVLDATWVKMDYGKPKFCGGPVSGVVYVDGTAKGGVA